MSPEGRQRKGPERVRVCSEVLVGEDMLAKGGKHCMKGPGPSRRQPGKGQAGFGRRGLPLKNGRWVWVGTWQDHCVMGVV